MNETDRENESATTRQGLSPAVALLGPVGLDAQPENSVFTKDMLRKHISGDWIPGAKIAVVIETPDGTRYPVESTRESVPGGPFVISARTIEELNAESIANGATFGGE